MNHLKKPKSVFILLPFLIGCALLAHTLVGAIYAGKQKTVVFIVSIPFLLATPYLLSKTRPYAFIHLLLFLFWLPVPVALSRYSAFRYLFTFEFGIWLFLLILYANSSVSKNAEYMSSLKRFPYAPFLSYIFGAFLTYFVSYKTVNDIAIIRTVCIFPFLLCLAIFVAVKSIDDAERLLWIALTSAAILGIVFLVGPKLFWFVRLAEYAEGCGRSSMSLYVPYLGHLTLLPGSTGNRFSFMLAFAYGFWIFHRSFLARTFAGIICVIFGLVIITAQGRGGAIAAIASALLISIYALITEKSLRTTILLKCAAVVALVGYGMWYLAVTSKNLAFFQHGTILLTDPLRAPNLLSRIALLKEGIRVFSQNPFFGVGLHGFNVPGGAGDTMYVHNLLLFLLLSFGIIGCAGFLWINVMFLRAFWQALKSYNRNVRMLCISSIGAMINYLFGVLSWAPFSVVMIWVPLAIAFAASKLEQGKLTRVA